ncbi:MAG: GTP 3',8-cyclase MoaA [Synergistaceae bacterium]
MDKLTDKFGRTVSYARISVTDRCNFRCKYCMPQDGVVPFSHNDILSYEEIIKLSFVLRDLGIEKIRFTGGEPLLRKDFLLFLDKFKSLFPSINLSFTTNASLLTKYETTFSKLNLDSINISLDTLDSDKFKDITLLGDLSNVLDGVKLAVSSKVKKVKLNTVLIRGFNDNEVYDLITYANKQGTIIRFIELMPLNRALWSKNDSITFKEMLDTLPNKCRKISIRRERFAGPAEYYTDETTGYIFGVITAMSNHFCKDCNRIRFSSTGQLRRCLFDPAEISVREYLHLEDERILKKIIIDSIRSKSLCWNDVELGHNDMYSIGG